MYPSRASPELLINEVTNYEPKRPSPPGVDTWPAIFERVVSFEDDGHAVKLIRALAHGKRVCKKWEVNDAFKIKGNMWDQIGHMVIDSVEAGKPTWVRSTGFNEAWVQIPDRQVVYKL
jgi:hypothetical protein